MLPGPLSGHIPTPEAIEHGRDQMADDYQTYVIDDAELARVQGTFQNLWNDPKGDPTTVYIGCPHNTYQETVYWSKKFTKALKKARQDKFAIPVVRASSMVVRNHR